MRNNTKINSTDEVESKSTASRTKSINQLEIPKVAIYRAIHGRVPPLGLFKRLIKLSTLVTIILPLNNIIYP